jgi:hypothetical protein
VDEALVAWHVDEAERLAVLDRQIGEAEIDGDAARLFFLQPVPIDPGQGFDQRSLAVVDMAGGADNHRTGPFRNSSSKRIDIQLGKNRDEFILVRQATQIERQSTIRDPSDHGSSQLAQSSG